MKKYDSIIAANYLLALAYEKKKVLNITKVQKLLFIAYGTILVAKGYGFIEEAPKAWPFGPVFPRAQKKANYSNIIPLNDPSFAEIREDQYVTEVLNSVIDTYADFSASQLSEWSHTPGSPWDSTIKKYGQVWNTPIEDAFIVDYFSKVNA